MGGLNKDMLLRWLLVRIWMFVVVMVLREVNAQEVTVTPTGPDVYVSQQASLQCSFSLPAELSTVTWYRDVSGQNDVILTYDNNTSTTVTSGTLSSRVEGELVISRTGTFHTLRINMTELGDQTDYFCNVTDVNNATLTNSSLLTILYSEAGLELTVEGVSSMTSSSLTRLAPINVTVTCFLPNSRPASDFDLGLFSYADNTTTSLKANAVVSQLVGDYGVTNTTVTTEVAMTTPGEYEVICDRIVSVMTSSSRLGLTIAASDADPCISSPCQNAGNCSNVTNGFVCACPDTHTGLLCDTVVPPPVLPCASDPCLNGGSCRNNLTLDTYECDCTECYNGTRCQSVAMDPCDANPCSTGLTCVISCPSYNCICAGTAAQCQTACAVRNPPPPTTSVTYGSSVNLTCEPPPVSSVLVQWFRTGQPKVLGTGNWYFVENATTKDEGGYECRVSGGCTSMAKTVLSVGYDIQPNKTENSTLSLATASSHTFTCAVTGQPEPLLYWEWTAADKPKAAPNTASGNETNNGSDVTTASPITEGPRQTKRMTSPAASPVVLTLSDVTSDHDGTYTCRANVMNLTEDDIYIKIIEVTVGPADKEPTCCKGKGGMAAWMIAIIVLVIVLILVAVIVAVIILLKKGKDGEGPFVCCFANAVHPDVKDVEKDSKHVPSSPPKYTQSYDDEMELEKKNSYYDNRQEDRHLVNRNEDSWSKAPSEEDEEEERDNRYNRREERARTPSPKSQNPIGSRARPLPPLDVNSERRRSRKKKKSRRSRPEPEEQEGSGNESPNNDRYQDNDD